ncbi:L,D-transpeptidase catalytic domain [Alteribacillus persepolensis]|uniref:L,D-transpeptidase catalytic domain n=1 Tax=Alteribacillus persepolensis TaxID=568899 RepID=A0A1G8K6N1_9BACI|nr:L,D-transpeptidase [Alteribacillus persepolensis]SDI39098.1 L,D-transpeptidase catalytic domain [Alteribacillus persepolensis]
MNIHVPLILSIFIQSVLWPLNPVPESGDPYIIINKQINQLGYVENGELAYVYHVATGKTEELTPEGEFTVTVKAIRPYYRKLNIKGGDPKNPLGSRWIGFDADNTNGRIYGIHGTNRPESIGRYISNGCIRMKNEEVNELFDQVEIGTKVWIEQSGRSLAQIAAERGLYYGKKPYYLEKDLDTL